MCGIFGAIKCEVGLSNNQVLLALRQMHHRGPDGHGVYIKGNVVLGMVRLSIIDLDGGSQPMYNENRDIAVVMNGEIYNYLELRKELISRGHIFKTLSDTEVVVHLFEEYGEMFPSLLRGMFSIAIHDTRKGRVFLVRDRLGKKPLYYYVGKEGLIFGSEIKSLLPVLRLFGVSLNLSHQAIGDYLSLMVVPQDSCIYQEIKSLPAGSITTIFEDRIETKIYWKLDRETKTSGNSEDFLVEVRRILREAVSIRLRSDVPIGVFLSGGIDSTIVAYESAKVLGPKLKTFTVGMVDPHLDESGAAARTASLLGIQNYKLNLNINPEKGVEFVVNHMDQPFGDSSVIPSWQISMLAREHVKVVLNGDGGDELFAGYRRHIAADLSDRLKWVPKKFWPGISRCMRNLPLDRRSKLGFLQRLSNGMSCDIGGRYLAWSTDMLRSCDKKDWLIKPEPRSTEAFLEEVLGGNKIDNLSSMLDLDFKINLLSDLLVKMDMATMAASVEARSPFLDHLLVEFAATIPSKVLLKNNVTKNVLRSAYLNIVPEHILNGRKRGFEVPMEAWLNGPLKSMVMDTIGQKNCCIAEFVAIERVHRLLRGEELQDRNKCYLVYSLLVLELWLRKVRKIEFGELW